MIIFCYLFLKRQRDVGRMLLLHQYISGIVLVKAVQNLMGKAKISTKRVRRKTGNYLVFTTVYQHPPFHICGGAVDTIDLKTLFWVPPPPTAVSQLPWPRALRGLAGGIMVADTQYRCTGCCRHGAEVALGVSNSHGAVGVLTWVVKN